MSQSEIVTNLNFPYRYTRIYSLQIKVSGEARAQEPYGSRGDDETECLTTLIKRHVNFIVKTWNLTCGV